MAKGWFAIPGVQDGDRTIAEQLTGLDRMLGLVAGKHVLDLGCAEGAIAHACLDHGAASVIAVDNNRSFAERAKKSFRLTVEIADLNHWPAGDIDRSADVVLLLAIVHKLAEPAFSLRTWAGLARQWIVIRLPIGSTGIFRSKATGHRLCDTHAVLSSHGFALDGDVEGPRGERVHYWRRVA